MPRVKQASKRKRVTKAVPVLGAAGLTFSLVGGASAAVAPATDVRRRRTSDRVTRSRSVKKKSPTSAWRRSMCSTRKTRSGQDGVQVARGCGGCGGCRGCRAAGLQRLRRLRRLRLRAACPGELAACAKPGRFPITLTNSHHGRVRQGRPGQSMFSCSAGASRGGAAAHDGRVGLQPCREMPARDRTKEFQWPENTPMQNRAGAASRVRVLTAQPGARAGPSSTRPPARTFRSSRRISPSMCCRPTSSASIPRTGNSFFTASFIARSPPRSEKAARAFPELVRDLGRIFRPTRSRKRSSG